MVFTLLSVAKVFKLVARVLFVRVSYPENKIREIGLSSQVQWGPKVLNAIKKMSLHCIFLPFFVFHRNYFLLKMYFIHMIKNVIEIFV